MKTRQHKNTNGAPSGNGQAALQDQIQKRAHEIWIAGGYRQGEDLDHWLQAEKEIMSQPKSPALARKQQPAL